MSRTAYSQHYACELDAKQLLTKLGIIKSVDTTTYDLPDGFRDWMRKDLRCPSCQCEGASLVRSEEPISGRSTRQAHFRFLDENRRTAHKVGCDFYPMGDEPGLLRGVDIDFSVNDADTRLLRRLVCQALGARIFEKADIFAMRRWFLDARDQYSFLVMAKPERIVWSYGLLRLRGERPLEFRPSHRAMPGFRAIRAAQRHMLHQYREVVSTARGLFLSARVRDETARLAKRYAGTSIIDLSPLEPQYDLTRRLAFLMVDLGDLKLSKTKHLQYGDRVSEALMALSATLLFVCDWNLDAALERFAKILAAPEPTDLSLGNVMGLNPFHDFASLRFLRWVNDQPPMNREFDFDAELKAVQEWIVSSFQDQDGE